MQFFECLLKWNRPLVNPMGLLLITSHFYSSRHESIGVSGLVQPSKDSRQIKPERRILFILQNMLSTFISSAEFFHQTWQRSPDATGPRPKSASRKPALCPSGHKAHAHWFHGQSGQSSSPAPSWLGGILWLLRVSTLLNHVKFPGNIFYIPGHIPQ